MHEKRRLNDNEKQIFLDLTEDDITKTLLTDFFTDRYSVSTGKIIPSRFNTFDEFILKKGDYPTITEDTLTNCGLFIFNKFLFEKDWVNLFGYINIPIDKKQFGRINDKLISAVMMDENGDICEKYRKYLNKMVWLSLTYHTDICSSISIKSSKPIPKVQKRKEELLAKNKKKLDAGDAIAAVAIQDELIKLAREELKDDQSIELYDSGARGSFDNAYRQELLIKGPIFNAANNKFEIMTNSLYEGADKNDIPSFGNAVVDGLYPKAISTGESGYDSKKIIAVLQAEVLDDENTDCHSKYPLTVNLTKGNIGTYKYHFIVTNDGFVRLDDSNQDKYIGKTVKMRLPSTCTGKCLCNRCAGDRFYLMGIKNIGLVGNRAANSLLNAKMKQSHDTTLRTFEILEDDMFVKR